jgi:putative transposase
VIDEAIKELAPVVGTAEACRVLGESRARHYRRHRRSPAPPRPIRPLRPQPRALSEQERTELRVTLDSESFSDTAPATVYAKLLDEGRYLASVSTMYRVLRAHDEVHERRRQATHPAHKKPELVATGPGEVWSWDISKLLGPVKWSYYYLYVVIDIYSRYVPGWLLARAENATLAKALISETLDKHGIGPDRLTLHSDRGSPMTAKPFVFLMADLGVTRSYSRPHTSNDNPYSESHFRTAKYRPDFPDRFGSYEDAHAWCRRFFGWYNHEHRHSGIGYHTPADVHFGRAELLRDKRAVVLQSAYAAHPERFVRKSPEPPKLPAVAWINEPKEVTATAQ